MGLQALALSSLNSMRSRLGESVTYTPLGGTGSTINVFYQTEQMFDDMGNYIGAQLSAVVSNTDVSAPRESDTITIGSTIWTVRKVQAGTYYHKLSCTKSERARY